MADDHDTRKCLGCGEPVHKWHKRGCSTDGFANGGPITSRVDPVDCYTKQEWIEHMNRVLPNG